ncbi:hypothetical protein COXBURSA334_0914 [Coxiella burnetii Q321]|nr:hypothetical protein COXBURSA334_0914 [Coxiella burnetii Q321]
MKTYTFNCTPKPLDDG